MGEQKLCLYAKITRFIFYLFWPNYEPGGRKLSGRSFTLLVLLHSSTYFSAPRNYHFGPTFKLFLLEVFEGFTFGSWALLCCGSALLYCDSNHFCFPVDLLHSLHSMVASNPTRYPQSLFCSIGFRLFSLDVAKNVSHVFIYPCSSLKYM